MPISDYLSDKTLTPAPMSTAEWDAIDAQTRERAFFMAGVTDARILSEFKGIAEQIANGEMGAAEGREQLRRFLEEYGYMPEEGEEGTIHDLSSSRRMEVALQTNEDLAAGWAQRRQQLGSLAHPGQRLFRKRQARAPRDWAARWRDAAQAVRWEGVAKGGEMVALITSPIWGKLSRFGYPYPPFDFNSGMWVMPVGIDECEALGLLEYEEYGEPEDDGMDGAEIEHSPAPLSADALTPRQADQLLEALPDGVRQKLDKLAADVETERRRSLNEGVQAGDMDADMQETLLAEMGGLVRFQPDGTLVMSDLNGTEPMTLDELADCWRRGIPETAAEAGVTNQQAKALQAWAANSETMTERDKYQLKNLLNRLKKSLAGMDAAKTLNQLLNLAKHANP